MLRFTGNYSNTNSNFVIQNIDHNKRNERNKYFQLICVIKNIILRGNPSKPSQFLQKEMGNIDLEKSFKLIGKEPVNWYKTIKGDDIRGYNPAREFLYDILPNNLKELEYIISLIIPEVNINEITGSNQEGFENQQVDFYLPQAKLVIEIDGQQHKYNDVNRISDEERNEYLNSYGIETIRINTKDLHNQEEINRKISEIKRRCREYNLNLKEYKNAFNTKQIGDEKRKHYEYTVILRLQILILSLLEYGILKIENKLWKLNIRCLENYDIKNLAMMAAKDLFLWLENISKLKGLNFKEPDVEITINEDIDLAAGSVDIDFSLLKRWTDENEVYKSRIFVRTDYFDEKDYFRVNTTDPINYKIIFEGEDSNIDSIKFFLKNIFGFEDFNDGQLPIIINALNGRDTVGLLPTGGGKSLCYQFSIMMQPCVSFCVVPIKSLMQDQKENLDGRGITRTEYISSDQSGEEKDRICQDFSQGRYFLVWISPERFQTKAFRQYLDELNRSQTIAFAVIDEVHCLSEWGHDFRTSYLQLCNTIRKYCPSTKFLGLTATASLNVLNDILVEFETTKDNVKTILEYTRPELTFIVQRDESEGMMDKYSKLERLLEVLDGNRKVFELKDNKTSCGIIFTTNKNGKMGCYELCNRLNIKYPDKVRWYSGELPKKLEKNQSMVRNFNEYKKGIQKDFKDNKFPLLIATKAFGMGIDKSNIRYTVHFGLPGSLESLYQEAGRAGRDKENAGCYILYSRELLSKEEMDVLFALDTDIESIQDIFKNQTYDNQRDVLRNFFLWISNNIGVDKESEITFKIADAFAEPGKTKVISCNEIYSILGDELGSKNNLFGMTQKAIYRLSLLGIVNDWTIEGWNKNGKFEVHFNRYKKESIFKALSNYIRKYDVDFSIEKLESESKYHKYADILNNKFNEVENAIKILIQWNYDNVFYNRRQSLKTLVELCEEYQKGGDKVFKERIEGYFKFTEDTYVLEHISQNPTDYNRWFQVFYDNSGKPKNKMQLQDTIYSLARFLESYRYNAGLNYVSGVMRLIIGGYDDINGRERLENSFMEIADFPDEKREEIFNNTLELSELMNDDSKENLSEIMCRYFAHKKTDIYKTMQDKTSLNSILEDNINALKNIGGNFR